MSEAYQSLTHARWNGKYHGVCVPKRRHKTLFGPIRQALGADLSRVGPAARMSDLLSRPLDARATCIYCIEIPPKHAVASVSGFLKGKSALTIARQLSGRERNCTGQHCGARGSAVSTAGCELEPMRASMRAQEQADDQGRL